MLSVICVAALAVAVSGSASAARPRLSGGSETSIGQYPFAAACLYTSGAMSQQHLATATIINNRSVLTLASLIHNRSIVYTWQLRAGSSFANSGGLIYDVNIAIFPPSWVTDPFTADIAVLRITTEFVYGINVQPTLIAGPDYILPDNTAVSTIGWAQTFAGSGFSDQLREEHIQTISQQTCSSTWGAMGMDVTTNLMCAGDLLQEQGLCAWDIGGPLLHSNVVIGITSSQPCGIPGLYTRVSAFTDFILDYA